jgi:hypothetical protein
VDIYPTFAQASGGAAAPVSVAISTFDKNFKPGIVQLWNLKIQHSITNSVITQIGYVGSKRTHLMGLFDINPALPSPSESPDATTRPYYKQFPQFGVIAAAMSTSSLRN